MAGSGVKHDDGFKYYYYDPSMAAAIIFIIVFLLLTSFQAFQVFKFRLHYFIVFTIGGIFEVIGYIGRAVNCNQTPDWTLGPYIIQAIFLLVSPALFAASIYMTLGRIVRRTRGESCSPIRPSRMTKIFVAGDVLSFLLQAGGGGLSATASGQSTGKYVIIGGLVVQLIWFGIFVIVASIFHFRMSRHTRHTGRDEIPWRKHMFVLYAVSALILIRSLYRTIEYAQGFSGYLFTHEVFLYIFDALAMTTVMVLYVVFPPRDMTKTEIERATALGDLRHKEVQVGV